MATSNTAETKQKQGENMKKRLKQLYAIAKQSNDLNAMATAVDLMIRLKSLKN